MENKVKIAVFVSGGGTNLQTLIDAEKSGIIKSGRVCAVISSKSDNYALEVAKNAEIPAYAVERKKYGEDIDGFCLEIGGYLRKHEIEFIVLAGFLSKLSPALCEEYKNRIINVHPALIPSFCGKSFYGIRVHEAALEYGVKISGATVHFVDTEYDHGKIIMQKAVDVLDGDTPEILQKRIMTEAEQIILPQAVEKVCKSILSNHRS